MNRQHSGYCGRLDIITNNRNLRVQNEKVELNEPQYWRMIVEISEIKGAS